MTRHDPRVSLQQMLDHAGEAVDLVRDRVRSDLDSDRLLNLALVRLLEIVGEAANRIPREVQQRALQIPWSEIVGMRHRLIHGYDQVDFDVLWQIVVRDLPQLVPELGKLLRELRSQ
jgi:uncharacterized protein with HEPN domain